MLKYNFKDFFKDNIIHNNEWVTNGHFLIKKSILTKGQQNFINKHPEDNNRLNIILPTVKTAMELFDDIKEPQEFIPESIFEVESHTKAGTEIFKALYNSQLELALKEEYYNYFTNIGCKICKGNGSVNPTLIFKNSEFVGILLPVRAREEKRQKEISYDTYITQLKQEQQAKEELKKLNKKCLYIVDNKAVVRNKPLRSVAELTGNSNYSNLYVNDLGNGYYELYIDLGIIYITSGRTFNKEYFIEEANYNLQGMDVITLEWYKDIINKRLTDGSNSWISVTDVKLMELAGEPKEYIEKLMQHRENIKRAREEQERKEQLKKQQEEQEYVNSQNKIVENTITEAEQAIIKGEAVRNKEITIYQSRYEYNTTSLILHMMKQYNIKVPLKTQGWINNALANINTGEYTYQHYKSFADSTVFYKYLYELVKKIKEKYDMTA